MPELPDVTVYIEALEKRIVGHPLESVQIGSLFLLRTVQPPIDSVVGHKVIALRRIGKRIAIGFDNDHWLVFHLMIAGRLHWKPKTVKPDGRRVLAAFDFGPGDSTASDAKPGALTLTEAGSQKRASLHLVANEAALAKLDPGGIDVFAATPEEFAALLTKENHTLKRALTDPRSFSGIGNAYSDEILHHAKLSPVALTQRLKAEEIQRLYDSTREMLKRWTQILRDEAGSKFPENVTAFRKEMAVHGKYKQPCPVCGTKVQRIRYASNETNYCPRCQTGGKLLADRALSRLLREDWPKSIDDLEDAFVRAGEKATPRPDPSAFDAGAG
jgi:formamidopyrimidine-DNA glycosylase